MPIPKPREGEEEQDFISRCMGDNVMVEEYPDQEQRSATCYQQWRDKKMTDIERKSVRLEFKDDKEGEFTARIATLNVVDSDGDMTKPGAFPEGKEILISSYQHGSWMGELPVGKAVIHEKDDEVIAEGEFNLKTTTGKDHYEAVKFTGELQEWSYGFLPIEAADETHDGQKIRVLTKVEPFEISPVLKGAGVGTATLGIKDGGWPYSEHMVGVLAALASATERSKSLADLRRKEGRVLSTANCDKIKAVLKVLSELKAELEVLLKDSDPRDTEKAAAATYLEYTRLHTKIVEVIKQ